MTTSSDVIDDAPRAADDDAPLPSATLGGEKKGSLEQLTLLLFIAVP
ncbi:acyl-CoA desaturase, partial [Streptomyces populi]